MYDSEYLKFVLRNWEQIESGSWPSPLRQRADLWTEMSRGRKPDFWPKPPTPTVDTVADVNRAIRQLPGSWAATVVAYRQRGTERAAARVVGTSQSTLHRQLEEAVEAMAGYLNGAA